MEIDQKLQINLVSAFYMFFEIILTYIFHEKNLIFFFVTLKSEQDLDLDPDPDPHVSAWFGSLDSDPDPNCDKNLDWIIVDSH
jgi:hypothetical protein